MQTNPLTYTFLMLLSAGSLTACGSSDSATGTGDNNSTSNEVKLDATAGGSGAAATDPANKFIYYDLDAAAEIELSDAEADTNLDWDIAFKRTRTKINGGASGPGSVEAALADAQSDFYDANGDANASVFLNTSKALEKNGFDAVTETQTLTFSTDENKPKIDGSLTGDDSWALYNPSDHSISAQSDAWNIVQSADGKAFAKLHVTDIQQASRGITVELFLQQDGETVFAPTATNWTANIGAAGGSQCFDFDSIAEVDCAVESSHWDIMLEVSADGFEWNLWSNGGIKGDGAAGAAHGAVQTIDMTYTGVGEADGQFPERFLVQDAPSGIFIDNSWYAYNLQGNHKLWPNYRVYAIKVGDKSYKMQFLSYYDTAGISGFINLRVEVI